MRIRTRELQNHQGGLMSRLLYDEPSHTWQTDNSYHVPALGHFQHEYSHMGDYSAKSDWRFKDTFHYKLNAFNGRPSDQFDPYYVYASDATFNTAYHIPIHYLLGYKFGDRYPGEENIEGLFSRFFSLRTLPTEVLIDKDPFDTEFSLWYLLVDLLDLINMFKHVYKLFSPNELAKFNGARKYYSKSKVTFRDVHDANLLYHFGIAATEKDIRDFFAVLMHWRRDYDHMTEFLRTLHRRRFEPVDVPEYNYQHNDVLTSHVESVDFNIYRNVETSMSVFHRTAQYKFTAPEFQGWMTRVKQFLDAFGVLDPAAVWDVIPFSFVLDWFVDIGGWLHDNRPRLFPADVSILDYCESFRLKRRITYSTSWEAPHNGGGSHTTTAFAQVAAHHHEYFVRRRFIPSVTRIAALGSKKSFVSLRRVHIASSLIGQRLPRG
jgi:hypothetical protein